MKILPSDLAVLEVVAAADEPISRTEIMARTGLSDASVRNAIRLLGRVNGLCVSQTGQTKHYLLGRSRATILRDLQSEGSSSPVNNRGNALPEPVATEGDPAEMTMAQLQQAVIDAWARGAQIKRPAPAERVEMMNAALRLAKAVKEGAYSLEEIAACTAEKVADDYNRNHPATWRLATIAGDLFAWKQSKDRRRSYTPPPKGWKSGIDPESGRQRIWDHQAGREVLVELAPLQMPERTNDHIGALPRPLPKGTFIRRDGETFSRDLYVLLPATGVRVIEGTDGSLQIVDGDLESEGER